VETSALPGAVADLLPDGQGTLKILQRLLVLPQIEIDDPDQVEAYALPGAVASFSIAGQSVLKPLQSLKVPRLDKENHSL